MHDKSTRIFLYANGDEHRLARTKAGAKIKPDIHAAVVSHAVRSRQRKHRGKAFVSKSLPRSRQVP